MTVVFYISSAVAIVSTLMVVTRLNAAHALLYLIVSLLSVAIVFFTLGAPFIAALEVIIYAGAIMVLFVFVMMMLNMGKPAVAQERRWLKPSMYIGPGILALILAVELVYVLAGGGTQIPDQLVMVAPKTVGISLYTTYLLGLEIAALLLLVGLVGAYHLGRGRSTETLEQKEQMINRREKDMRLK